jgi:hypothetical protein
MKVSKLFMLVTMIAVLVFAFAASAYAEPGGTVYGQATMQPTVSVTLSGAGSDSGNPLTYSGLKNEGVWANSGGTLTVTNTGETATTMFLGYGSDPTDGNTTWHFDQGCSWTFFGNWTANVPASGVGSRPLCSSMSPGASMSLVSRFKFPNTYDGSTHSMTALIIAEGEI